MSAAWRALLGVFALLALVGSRLRADAQADLVLLNGKSWTVDKARPEVEALAIRGERIVQLGPTAVMRQLIGATTRVIDLQGKRVVPGFYDSHAHLLNGGQLLSRVDLKD